MIIRFHLYSLLAALASVVFAAQPSAAPPASAPLRELPWGQLNFLHTTDTHGWHAGHLSEPSFSADWGDYISFAERLHERADKEGVDLLLIDTGDRVEGNGLYDASDPKGKYTLGIVAEQNIDLICSGNHELYKTNTSAREYYETAPDFQGNYLASNIDFIDPKTGQQVPLAQRYKKFTTKNQGIRIIAFGFLFDFTANGNNTVIQKVEDAIKEKWFQNAIHDRDVDLFVVIGHIPLRSSEFALIYRAIRQEQWDIPIQFFGGHSHIRDYVSYDRKAFALESGRYMETIGFAAVSGLSTGGKKSSSKPFLSSNIHTKALRANPNFARRYIDNNLYSFHQHTSLNETTFPTPHGKNVSDMISTARKALDLDNTYGCAPSDYWTNRAPFPNDNSIFTWLQDIVLPTTIQDPSRADVPRLVLINTGALRFDIFKGPFTVDTMYAVSPFTSGFRFIKDVPFSTASRLLQILNQEVPQLSLSSQSSIPPAPPSERNPIPDIATATTSIPRTGGPQIPLANIHTEPRLTPGYTTTDDLGSDGDDTIHARINFYRVPNCIESRIGFPLPEAEKEEEEEGGATAQEDPESVDLVYVDFIEAYVLLALRFLGTGYAAGDTGVYMEGKGLTGVIGGWVRENWECQ